MCTSFQSAKNGLVYISNPCVHHHIFTGLWYKSWPWRTQESSSIETYLVWSQVVCMETNIWEWSLTDMHGQKDMYGHTVLYGHIQYVWTHKICMDTYDMYGHI